MKYDSFLCETVFHMFYIYPTLWVFHYTVEHMGQSKGSKEKARWSFIHSKNVMKRGTYSLFMLKCFLIFFSIGPRVRLIITTTQIPCKTCQPPVNRSCWNIRCLFWVELIFSLQKSGRKIILTTKPIETQNNSYATTDDTKMSPNQGGIHIIFLPSSHIAGTHWETRDTCREPVKTVSRWTLQLNTALMADLSTKKNSVQFTGSVWQAFNWDPTIKGHFPIKPW